MAEGYWRNGQLVSLVNDEGWYATRDRGEMHNGKLTIVGRLDNLFFSGGHSIALSCLLRVFTSIYRLTDKLFINGNGMAEMRSETEG